MTWLWQLGRTAATRCSTDPELIAEVVATKTITTTYGRKARVRRYSDIRIVDTIKEWS